MKKFRFCYSVDGVMTMLPLFVTVEAETKEEAIGKAEEKIKQTFLVKMGNNFKIYK